MNYIMYLIVYIFKCIHIYAWGYKLVIINPAKN